MAVFLLLASVPRLHAQSAEIFTAKRDGFLAGGVETTVTKEAEPVDNTPSRFAGDDIAAYTASRAAALSMKNRATDPFGLYQDPNAKPVEKKVPNDTPSKRQAALPPTPLSDIVKLIRVTTIMPGEKKFLVGVRSFSESEDFTLIFQGKRMSMKIVEVSAQSIIFRNLKNGETAALRTEMLPPGMMAGGGKLTPPGMVSPLDDMPLELGAEIDPAAQN